MNLTPLGIHYCSDEIELLRRAREADVTAVTKYVAHFTSKTTNRNAKRLLLKDFDLEKETAPRQRFEEAHAASAQTAAYLSFLQQSTVALDVLGKPIFDSLVQQLTALLEGLRARAWENFTAWKETCLLNSAITLFRKEVERKTGASAKPTTTGFQRYASTRMEIAQSAAAILKSVDTAIPALEETVGNLGPNKGALALRTEFAFQSGTVADSRFASLTRVKKATQKKFAKEVRGIHASAFRDDLFQCIARLNGIEDVEDIKTVYELVLFKKYFALEGGEYEPSSGEASMVMLQAELERDADVYILDEPERSLGNEYISDVIVPLIRERARAGKRIFISTHDANIAVRTLPYSSIYRSHGSAGYHTYIGNPFSNSLVCTDDDTDQLDWREVSMRTLEGGPAAFGERGRIYGHN